MLESVLFREMSIDTLFAINLFLGEIDNLMKILALSLNEILAIPHPSGSN